MNDGAKRRHGDRGAALEAGGAGIRRTDGAERRHGDRGAALEAGGAGIRRTSLESHKLPA